MSKCYTDIKAPLIVGSSLNPCSKSMKQSASVDVLFKGIFLALFLEYF
jgi:hypothetical protein